MNGPIDWDAIYGLLINAGVGNWEYIDEYMTIPRYHSLQKYWMGHPPLSVSCAAIAIGLGVIKPRSASNDLAKATEDFGAANVQIPGVKRG